MNNKNIDKKLLTITFNKNEAINFDCDGAFVFIASDMKMSEQLKNFDEKNGKIISLLLEKKSAFDGKFGSMKTLSINSNNKLKNIVVVGLGDTKELDDLKIEELGSKILLKSNMLKFDDISLFAADVASSADKNARLALGIKMASYKFDKYFTEKKSENEDKNELTIVNIFCNEHDSTKTLFEEYYLNLVKGIFLARDCISEPPNVLYPESYANKIIEAFSDLKSVNIKILNHKELKELNMNALLGVGQGSVKESKVVIMEYNGGNKDEKPLAFAGKGVCFDTGGISLKPPGGMEDMKYDMAGSASVVGLMMTLASRKAKVNAVGIVGLVENMPDGNAQRPSDVVFSASGKSIEVLNTDAEGRLVLADILWYVQKNYNPKILIDLATLTGAILIALGTAYAGAFSNNDELAEKVCKSGAKVKEKVWRMPMDEVYEKMIKSEIADVANISTSGKGAGSATAAHFLQKFVEKDMPWVHLDIAGMAWAKSPTHLCNKGAVGFGVRLLDQMVRDYYESKKA